MKAIVVIVSIIGLVALLGVGILFVLDRTSDPSIRFYGRVVNVAGQPVAGAEVTVLATRDGGGRLVIPTLFASGGGSSEVLRPVTDASGTFVVATRAKLLSVERIGGGRLSKFAETSFHFGNDAPGHPPPQTSASSPHIFVLEP